MLSIPKKRHASSSNVNTIGRVVQSCMSPIPGPVLYPFHRELHPTSDIRHPAESIETGFLKCRRKHAWRFESEASKGSGSPGAAAVGPRHWGRILPVEVSHRSHRRCSWAVVVEGRQSCLLEHGRCCPRWRRRSSPCAGGVKEMGDAGPWGRKENGTCGSTGVVFEHGGWQGGEGWGRQQHQAQAAFFAPGVCACAEVRWWRVSARCARGVVCEAIVGGFCVLVGFCPEGMFYGPHQFSAERQPPRAWSA